MAAPNFSDCTRPLGQGHTPDGTDPHLTVHASTCTGRHAGDDTDRDAGGAPRAQAPLGGDTEADTPGAWLNAAVPHTAAASSSADVQAVVAMARGLPAEIGTERPDTRLAIVAGSAGSTAATIWAMLPTEPALLTHALITDRLLVTAVALVRAGVLIRMVPRSRLRGFFRGGLSLPRVQL